MNREILDPAQQSPQLGRLRRRAASRVRVRCKVARRRALQIHILEGDELAIRDGDMDIACAVAGAVLTAELFLYPGSGRLFSDPALPGYEPATALAKRRVLSLLAQA